MIHVCQCSHQTTNFLSFPSLSSRDEALPCTSKKKQKVKHEQVEKKDKENRTRIAWARVNSAKILKLAARLLPG